MIVRFYQQNSIAMLNSLLFLSSLPLMIGFAWFFWRLGQSALTAWIAILSLLANLFVLKQINLFGLNATASDIFVVGNLLALNLMQERFGYQAAQQAIWTSFGCLLFFVIMSQIHLHYLPSHYDQSQAAYGFLFTHSPRILVASLATFLLIEQCNSRLYRLLRLRCSHLSLTLVSIITLCICQLLDTILFAFLGLYGMVSAITEIILISYTIKLIIIAASVPWSFISQRLFVKSC